MQQDWTLTVSQLNEYVRRQLAADPVLRGLRVRGEISGCKRAVSGHFYFSLKDEQARVQCVLFRQNAPRLRFTPADGMRVTVFGSASIFPQTGAFQVYVEDMERSGVGEMYLRFEALKSRLAAEGLFDAAIKRPLPLLPRCVGIATSRSGAVLHDILRVGWKRWPNMRFVLAPCSVQGDKAAGEIVSALRTLDESGLCDVILCGRGGGSLEELWPFNEEEVARAIRATRTPVVSCVGHETDFTIADLAADVRAATPTEAAQIVLPERTAFLEELAAYREDLHDAMRDRLSREQEKLRALSSGYAFASPSRAWVEPRRQDLRAVEARLRAAFTGRLHAERSKLSALPSRLGAAYEQRVRAGEVILREQKIRIDTAYEKRIHTVKGALRLAAGALEALRPGAPLERGWALIERNGRILDHLGALRAGDRFSVIMRDGRVEAQALQDMERSNSHAEEKREDL